MNFRLSILIVVMLVMFTMADPSMKLRNGHDSKLQADGKLQGGQLQYGYDYYDPYYYEPYYYDPYYYDYGYYYKK